MTENGRWKARALPLAALSLIALGTFLRLENGWTDLDLLSRTTLPDDAFYDFAIARNIARGVVPSIDGVHPTNGYHPLWVALLSVVYRILPDGDGRAPIHVALTLGALFDAGALFLLYRIARRTRLSVGALFALAVVALSPYATVNATCGLETPLALLVLLLLVDRHLRAPPNAGPRWFVGFGVLAGLCVLARTDAAVLALVLGGCTIRRVVPAGRRLSCAALAGASATGVALPWIAYSWATTGTVVQSSAVALSLVMDRLPQIWGLPQTGALLRLERGFASLREAMDLTVHFFGIGRLPFYAAGLLAACGLVVARRRQRRLVLAQLARLGPMLGALLLLFGLHVFVREVYRPWYTAPMVAGLALVLGLSIEHLLRALPLSKAVTAVLAVALAFCLQRETRVWQSAGLYGLANYRGMNPNDTLHEGHTDCGAVAYFHRAGITNLDGVVNNDALAALRAGRMLDYLRAERFDRVYATDHYHSSVFFGERYRESLRTSEHDVRAVRLVVDDAEKDRLITLGAGAISLGGAAGRELLSDGWLWLTDPPERGWAVGMGETSDVIFALPAPVGARPSVELELRAAVVSELGEQPIDVEVDGRAVTTWRVALGPARWFSAPIAEARPGRHRLHLRYGAARAVRDPGPHGSWDWWRSLRGNLVRAVDANGIRVVRSEDLALPPSGPTFADPASDRLLVSGFLPVERDAKPAAVWAIGPRAELVFYSEAAVSDRVLRLEAGPPPRDGDEGGQRITVWLNGRPLGTLDFPPDAISALSLPVHSADLMNGDNHLVLTFERTAAEPGGSLERAAYFRAIELR